MLRISASQIIHVWERGLSEHPVNRALTLLSLACPDTTREVLALFTIGQRDAHLLAMRESIFGASLQSVAACPQCRTLLEFSVDARELLSAREPHSAAAPAELDAGGLHVRFRAPNSLDLAAIVTCLDVAEARRALLQRCILEAHDAETAVMPADVPEPVMEAVAAAIAETDRNGDIVLELHCGSCSQPWSLIIDIASFFWEEISRLAKRLLHQVHQLAWAYGWSEQDILNMSSARREFYLDMVTG